MKLSFLEEVIKNNDNVSKNLVYNIRKWSGLNKCLYIAELYLGDINKPSSTISIKPKDYKEYFTIINNDYKPVTIIYINKEVLYFDKDNK